MRPVHAIALAPVIVFSWVVVPQFVHARNRSRQKQTMADMRTIATAWEARASDINSYSVGPGRRSPGPQHVSAAELALALEPKYIRKLPRRDGWGTEFQFTTSGYDETYFIRSYGSDGEPDRILNVASGATTNFADDLIYSNGSFIQYPESSG
jgi:type II secretory pathway pseudopilin PulG